MATQRRLSTEASRRDMHEAFKPSASINRSHFAYQRRILFVHARFPNKSPPLLRSSVGIWKQGMDLEAAGRLPTTCVKGDVGSGRPVALATAVPDWTREIGGWELVVAAGNEEPCSFPPTPADAERDWRCSIYLLLLLLLVSLSDLLLLIVACIEVLYVFNCLDDTQETFCDLISLCWCKCYGFLVNLHGFLIGKGVIFIRQLKSKMCL